MTVGILGVGWYQPATERPNDWWPAARIEDWRHQNLTRWAQRDLDFGTLTPGVRRVVTAMRDHADDPFQGARERRVADAKVPSSELEVQACKQALAQAGVKPRDIGLIVGSSLVPDHVNVPNACALHDALGCRRDCLALTVDASSNSLLMQMSLARRLAFAPSAPYALLVQSSLHSRVLDYHEPHSGWFGDAATAVVLGPCDPEWGLLAEAHRTDGRHRNALLIGAEVGNWYDARRCTLHTGDGFSGFQVLLGVADRAQEVVADVLAQAGISREKVAFFACHQASGWMREICQTHAGLSAAAAEDTFVDCANLAACNVPAVLHRAQTQNALRPGDFVVLHGGGCGITWSAMLLRWVG